MNHAHSSAATGFFNSLLNPGAGGSGCTGPTAGEGEMLYNGDHHVLQYCDGDDWRAVGMASVASGLAGPSGCTNIGDQCADTTIFAGWHPFTHEQLFIPTTDQGTTSAWKTSTGTNDIATDSTYDGRANTNQIANSTTFPAFKLCKDLGTGSHTDWYLPSRAELDYLYVNRSQLESGPMTDFQNDFYWSSSENGTSGAQSQLFNGGNLIGGLKTNDNRVRCVRR